MTSINIDLSDETTKIIFIVVCVLLFFVVICAAKYVWDYYAPLKSNEEVILDRFAHDQLSDSASVTDDNRNSMLSKDRQNDPSNDQLNEQLIKGIV